MNVDKLDAWEIPKWHSDFGDPKIEFKMLVDFCRELLTMKSTYHLILENYEEGYISVDIFTPNGKKFGELMIVEAKNGKQYGLFYDLEESEKEFYFTSIEEGLKCFI